MTPDTKALNQLKSIAIKHGFKALDLLPHKNSKGEKYHELILLKSNNLNQLDAIFAASSTVSKEANKLDIYYWGWEKYSKS